ncbi:hypothetical protein GIB67_035083 [Kingdonia uniflora]|uniref:Protein BCCIP homolog n=1 Tax=Kingdonia uniflora TaxID=39325 RepID=A0A7J7P7F3_9MAGN|nr:hypothetical protein GIB67_035083 [Kingdonia uniflora]
MPRRPTKRKHQKSSKAMPITFSSFARSVARMSTNRNLKQPSSSKNSASSLNGSTKQVAKEKIIQVESSSEDEDEGNIQADFAFFDPKADDFQGVKMLLQTYLDDLEWDLSGLVDLVLGQTTVGTVVKIEDEEDNGLFSVVTALNLARYKDHKCVNEIKGFLLKACQDKDVTCKMRLLIEEQAHNIGLLVSQRVLNLPPQLLPPLYDALFDEVSWATEDEPTEELRKSFRFKFYLLATRIYKHKNADRQKGASTSSNEEPIIYIKSEDEIFHKLSAWSFSFSLRTNHVSPHELKDYKLIGLAMAVEADKVPTFRRELHSLINDS